MTSRRESARVFNFSFLPFFLLFDLLPATMNIPLDQLIDHPLNSNIMSRARFATLKRHIARSGWYPPLVVRPIEEADTSSDHTSYQILDGHHRARALRELRYTTAACVVWNVDDDEAALLLATLNRLEGSDDPSRRAKLLETLCRSRDDIVGKCISREDMAAFLPESRRALAKMLELNDEAPKPKPVHDQETADLPVPVTFFFSGAQHRSLLIRLRATGIANRSAAVAYLLQLDDA